MYSWLLTMMRCQWSRVNILAKNSEMAQHRNYELTTLEYQVGCGVDCERASIIRLASYGSLSQQTEPPDVMVHKILADMPPI